MAKTPKLTVLFEKLRGQTFLLEQESMTIGRRDEADIVLKDGSVSGKHAIIFRSGDGDDVTYYLRDNDSTNGTRVNNQLITGDYALKNSDLITFGNVEVLFDGDRADSGSPTDFSHLTHTIDISSLEENTSAPQTLTNFNPRAEMEAKKNDLFQRGMLLTIILIAFGVLALAGVVIVKIFNK